MNRPVARETCRLVGESKRVHVPLVAAATARRGGSRSSRLLPAATTLRRVATALGRVATTRRRIATTGRRRRIATTRRRRIAATTTPTTPRALLEHRLR